MCSVPRSCVPGLDLGPDREKVLVSTRLAPGDTWKTKAWPNVEWSLAKIAFKPIGFKQRASRPQRRSQMKEGASKSWDCSGHSSRTNSGDACKNCGGQGKKDHHPLSYCPANEATCHRCGKECHLEVVFNVHKPKEDTTPPERAYSRFHDSMKPRAQEQGGFHDFMANEKYLHQHCDEKF